MDILFPVILSVPMKKQQLKGKEKVLFLSQLARSAVKRSAEKNNICIDDLKKDENGAPLPSFGHNWSISHKPEYVTGVVSKKPIGIDLEKSDRKVSFGISRHICTPSELDWVKQDEAGADSRLKMIFSSKESIYKALYPIEKVELGFMDANLIWDPLLNIFRGKLLRSAGKGYPSGLDLIVGCKIIDGFIFSYMSLPSDFIQLDFCTPYNRSRDK